MSSLPTSSGETSRFSWGRIWAGALLMFAIGLLAAEGAWRGMGYRPSAADSPALWKYWYEKAVSSGPRTIVLIGASRSQAGISPREVRRRLPGYQVVQLGVYAGGSPIGVLRQLAADERFEGIVICDMLAPFLLRERWEDQRGQYDSHANRKERFDAYWAARKADFLASINVEFGVGAALREWIEHDRLPTRNHVRMRPDRSIELDFSIMEDLEDHKAKNAALFRRRYESAGRPTPAKLDEDLKAVDECVLAIQQRGGQVVFLRMPSSGARFEIEEEYHPKTAYWDRFGASNSGVAIHWLELPNAQRFVCVDESHLDYRQAVEFTGMLVNELILRGVLSEGEPE